MKIALMYCGGCNPYYDRVGAASHIKSVLSSHTFESYNSDEVYEHVIVINGCPAMCANPGVENATYIGSFEEAERIADKL